MLLRSSSAPLPNSGIRQYCKDSVAVPEPILQTMPKSRSCSEISLSSSSSAGDYSFKKMSGALSGTDIKSLKKPSPEYMSVPEVFSTITDDEEEHEKERDVEGLSDSLSFLSNSGLNLEEGCEAGFQREKLMTEVMMGGGSGGGGRRTGCGGSGDDDGGGGGDENEDDSEYRGRSTDVYYKALIEANPGNPLLLSNYARYLKEVRADFVKAEEYCEKAVMANPDDGNILSLYAELKWQIHKDPVLAENYFHQSVKAAPEDCYVLASYANFLWEAEEEYESKMKDADYSSLSR